MVENEQWTLLFTRKAEKDAKKIASAGLIKNVNKLLDILEINPFQTPPPYEKLLGDLAGCYSRRVNFQHRLVYEVNPDDKTVTIFRMFTHYGE